MKKEKGPKTRSYTRTELQVSKYDMQVRLLGIQDQNIKPN